MKHLFLSALLCCSCICYGQQQTALIKGRLLNVKEFIPYIYYSYETENGPVSDSVPVTHDRYTIPIKEELPLLIHLRSRPLDDRSRPRRLITASVYIQPGINEIFSKDSFPNTSIPHNTANKEYIKLETASKIYSQKEDSLGMQLRAARSTNDTATMFAVQARLTKVQRAANGIYETYARQHPQSPIALYALTRCCGAIIDAEKAGPLFDSLPVAVKHSTAGRNFEKRLLVAKKVSGGAAAPGFSQADTSGKQVALADFKGNYLLLEFWASWCIPCRLSNPSLVALFNRFREKGFTILSVSLDKQEGKQKWIDAIRKDGLNWTHISSLDGFDNPVAKLYDVHEIPQNFLIGPDGKIIARNLDVDGLENRLAPLLK
ncbi:peroxiredoxin family protein [Niabella beijingensis]|uniref:peroxiredoxin family protein n=1 Tax=Niabella beijingensis TaxID=2872700 RepID=UPI001CC117E3|nr:TlpA disulfide reductase family protein [Niabella beijingensis]MBZ4190160.1 TlpA family protein disulfide reductase [Niabella beijingensis]